MRNYYRQIQKKIQRKKTNLGKLISRYGLTGVFNTLGKRSVGKLINRMLSYFKKNRFKETLKNSSSKQNKINNSLQNNITLILIFNQKDNN